MKVTVYGDPDIGKTSIILKYTRDSYNKYLEPTIGASYHKSGDVNVWDTSGTPRYSGITQSIGRGSDVIMYVFSVTDTNSFKGVSRFLELTKTESRAKKILVGNKIDLCRTVEYDTAKSFAETIPADYIEVSAKTGSGIQELFALAKAAGDHTESEVDTGTNIFIDTGSIELEATRLWNFSCGIL